VWTRGGPGVQQRSGDRARALSYALMCVGVAAPFVSVLVWTFSVGPHMDTSFEYLRLAEADSLAHYLRLLALDNQPPGQMFITWLTAQAVGMSFDALRVAVGVLTAAAVLCIAAWGLDSPGWSASSYGAMRFGSPAWARSIGLFGLAIAASPAVAPALVMLRYSSALLPLWLLAFVLLVRLIHGRTRRTAFAVGLITGMGFLISYSSVALALLVTAATIAKVRTRLIWVLVGMLPGFIGTLLWARWAGDAFVASVFSRGQAPIRMKIASLYENLV
jgi:hypothetical protein